jgi:predicted phosphate transport protein (TIGR00153 family)
MLRLLPKETRFFDLFEAQASKVHEAAKALQELARNYDHVEEKARHIKVLESQADSITHDIIDKLNRTFITPFDREDIHALASALDDVLDNIEGVSSRLVLFQIRTVTPETVQLASIIEQACGAIVTAISSLRDFSRIGEYLIQINHLENEADHISRNVTAKLFLEAADFRELIKWKEIYGRLEATTDDCEDVANILEGIAVKNT